MIRANEIRYKEFLTESPLDILVVGFGTAGRIAQTAVQQARKEGIRVGLLRPISLYPFPTQRIAELSTSVCAVLVVEMNAGQMVADVRLAVEDRVPVHFTGHMGGMLIMPDEILDAIRRLRQDRESPVDIMDARWLEQRPSAVSA